MMKAENPTAVQMRKVEDTFCHDDMYRKKEVCEECDSQFFWDSSPGTNGGSRGNERYKKSKVKDRYLNALKNILEVALGHRETRINACGAPKGALSQEEI
jgi:hypothetical protein